MDKSLDELVAARPKGGIRRGNGRRNTARTQVLGTPVVSPTGRARAAASVQAVISKPVASAAVKIVVSNLPQDVNEAQIKELFQQTVGPLREVALNYDANGRSKGVATVTFHRRGDGDKAWKQYNGRLIDGKRAMKIEVIVDPSQVPPPPLAARVAPPPADPPAATNGTQATRRPGGGRGRGGRRGGGAGPGRKAERPAKTAEDLDAEMEDYTASNGTAPVAAV
ncbi:hypothetical protein OF83DRAFT_1091387 [Amylostereum chailletii]|nr:hypothetical protein OF83DRAFT_1091387 [Amylostereum chailletii]